MEALLRRAVAGPLHHAAVVRVAGAGQANLVAVVDERRPLVREDDGEGVGRGARRCSGRSRARARPVHALLDAVGRRGRPGCAVEPSHAGTVCSAKWIERGRSWLPMNVLITASVRVERVVEVHELRSPCMPGGRVARPVGDRRGSSDARRVSRRSMARRGGSGAGSRTARRARWSG